MATYDTKWPIGVPGLSKFVFKTGGFREIVC